MANKLTLTFLLFFVALLAKGYGLTWCLPQNDYFENIQTLLNTVAPQYGVQYSGEKIDTHPTVQRILDRLDNDRAKQMSAKQRIEEYTAEKLRHYEVTPIVTGSDNVVVYLKNLLSILDAENNENLNKLEQYRKANIDIEQELNGVLQQIQSLSGANVALEKTIDERNVTLTKTLETQSHLQKIIAERGLA
uniref:Secreted protein n=1 Tax=Anopheles funestus TaxID=62324 RepID=A0A4Y0BE30_ANOFN